FTGIAVDAAVPPARARPRLCAVDGQGRSGRQGSELADRAELICGGPSGSERRDVDDRLRERLWRLLRQVVADAAGDRAMFVSAGELLRVAPHSRSRRKSNRSRTSTRNWQRSADHWSGSFSVELWVRWRSCGYRTGIVRS